jgi:hypothetical protein
MMISMSAKSTCGYAPGSGFGGVCSLTTLCASERRDRAEKGSRTDLQFLNIQSRGTLSTLRAFSMADSGKKRKRNDEGAPKPNKKIAIQAPLLVKNVSVSVVTGIDDWAPIVGTHAQTPSLLQSGEL